MRNLDLLTLRLFAAVCEQRSIARVAEQESIVGSAISKRLAQLEHAVGTPLLVRKRRGVAPTPAGKTLLEHARTMLASVGQIERDMAAYATGIRGHVRMLVTASVMAESLADDVAAFLQDPAHRDIQVSMEERVSPEVVRGIHEGSASIGICWDAADLTGLETCAYRSDHLAVVAHDTHPVAQASSVCFADVLGYEFVSMPALSAVQVLLARAAAVEGKALAHRVLVSNFDAALRVVGANLAISVVPREVAEPFALTAPVRIVPLSDSWAQRRFAVCYRSSQALPPCARLLVDHLARAGLPAGG
ncbi:LysR family transcriptional regulator [Acidovorax carolinensis]|uniref:LysR family transcriptional regulator n=1 Tax=Acidovorax carolinensis TaxID=553814 RepID=A0A240UF71_9BURK|nr:LysR family transcriptional regulator [Acidovorax carolinensis]ART54630.1 LysR family transcriptional regulator [Acidovorax carolinensis]ART59689.1 LysR family transcriptional regulator [Acidovorax carolinensis]